VILCIREVSCLTINDHRITNANQELRFCSECFIFELVVLILFTPHPGPLLKGEGVQKGYFLNILEFIFLSLRERCPKDREGNNDFSALAIRHGG